MTPFGEKLFTTYTYITSASLSFPITPMKETDAEDKTEPAKSVDKGAVDQAIGQVVAGIDLSDHWKAMCQVRK